ncbi:hypothetical protein [Actinoplanes sp. RD1]|uniref:hypothetical protein n=1 Tax=Actinoplanes sp. RD1 TaxID=3064538 RepID=UPI002741BA08|nr:hypothetical protein [Actinoplanes sp. RD1]
MSDHTQPHPASGDLRTPRTLASDVMRELISTADAAVLGEHPRFRMFARYDNHWWVDAGNTFIEITGDEQTRKLDRWHQRMSQGSLWA